MMITDDQLMTDLLEEATDEPLDLFHAIALVKIVEGGEGRLPLLARTAPLIVELVRKGRLVCGDWSLNTRGAFDPWGSSADDAAAVVEDYVRRVLHGEQTFIPTEPCLFALPDHVQQSESR